MDVEVMKVTGVESRVQTVTHASPVCTHLDQTTIVDEARTVHEATTVGDAW